MYLYYVTVDSNINNYVIYREIWECKRQNVGKMLARCIKKITFFFFFFF
jgi:hypothetical protein